MSVPMWYQSLGMVHRLEQLVVAVGEMSSDGEILENLSEVVTKLTNRTNESIGNSSVRLQTPDRVKNSTVAYSTPVVRPNAHESSLSGSDVPKTVKIDFPYYESKGNPTIWLIKAALFFQLHGILVLSRVAPSSFHLKGDAYLWYQLLQHKVGTVTWEEFRCSLNSR
ncbi:hypothetical protein Dsin_032485 [Dipteronia sinensis]|uniref:Retrotransposon gag domain-containing protein n=1 Tax=Dipteronia sinensis TaxID=43782 RepID=A0AAD9ZPS5_9ROSI|nr:hypothetical protein Dsin_032485 [Dipteronia sinensis]